MSTKRHLLVGAFAGALALGATSAQAVSLCGFYLGGQLGSSDTHYTADTGGITSATSIDTSGTAGRAYLGYQFDQNWGLELGYTRTHTAEFSNMNSGTTKGLINQHAYDLDGVGRLPFDNGFGLMGKIGVQHYTANPDAALIAAQTLPSRFGSNRTATGLLWGVGASYDFNPNVSADIGWTRFGQSKQIQNVDLLTVGVAYYFG